MIFFTNLTIYIFDILVNIFFNTFIYFYTKVNNTKTFKREFWLVGSSGFSGGVNLLSGGVLTPPAITLKYALDPSPPKTPYIRVEQPKSCVHVEFTGEPL